MRLKIVLHALHSQIKALLTIKEMHTRIEIVFRLRTERNPHVKSLLKFYKTARILLSSQN